MPSSGTEFQMMMLALLEHVGGGGEGRGSFWKQNTRALRPKQFRFALPPPLIFDDKSNGATAAAPGHSTIFLFTSLFFHELFRPKEEEEKEEEKWAALFFGVVP